MKYKQGILIATLAICTISIFAFYQESSTSDRFEIGKNLDVFTEVYKEVNEVYVDGTQPGELMKTGIDAMLKSLDPYTVYYPESEIEDYKLLTTGQYGGIGARIRQINDFVVISEPYKGFPAQKAGLKAGDVILKVDGKDVKGKSTSDLSKILKGNPGTSLTVLIDRPGQNETFEITFKREKVQIPSVPFKGMLNENIGYIKMSSFTRDVSQEVKEAFLSLKKNANFNALVFDLRGNPGGLLHEAINTVGLFTKKNIKVVETRAKLPEWTKIYKTLNQPIDKEMPIVVLINGSSASASEIVSGSLQDFDRAVVLGRNSYGKGLVQKTKNLKYNTSIKVTTAKYYIPSGRCIQAIDYAHKDKNGKPIKMPDSLLTEFKTANGRTVLDGAGIKPDVEISKDKFSELAIKLSNKHLIFNFATQYALKYDSIARPDEFNLSDADFEEFLSFVNTKDIELSSKLDEAISNLEEVSESENIKDSIKVELELLRNLANDLKARQFNDHKEELKNLIEKEIVTRYYYQEGKIRNALSDDPDIIEAIKILSDNTRYQSILSPKK